MCTYGREGVCTCVPMDGVYLWKEYEGECTYGRGGMGVYLWKGCVPMEGVCTYGRGV